MDLHLECLHTETGPGVLEAAIMVDESINSADKATLYKTFSKVLFQKRSYHLKQKDFYLKLNLIQQDTLILTD